MIKKRDIGYINMYLIYLTGIIVLLWWGLCIPICGIVDNFKGAVMIDSIFEIIWKCAAIGCGVIIAMVINCYFFTNVFDKD